MALIGTLRNKLGIVLVAFIFLALLAFILGELFTNNSVLFGNNDVGEIGGHSISIEEYQQAIQEREANYVLNFGRQPTDREMPTLRQQAWELLILRYAIQKEFDKVGVNVTTEEQQDMIWGKNVDENIKQAFTNQQTGQFDKDQLLNYLKNLNTEPTTSDPQQLQMWQEQRARWETFQRDMAPGRERIKYENLLIKSNYVTKAEAEREYHLQNDVAEVKYVYVPFYAIADSVAQVTDEDLKQYYNKNAERFKTEHTRDLKYVTFSLAASSKDTADIRNEMQRLATEFTTTNDDSAFAAAKTFGKEPFATYNPSSLPPFIKTDDLKKGNVIGPFVEGGSYKIVKISDITTDTVYSARASHILFKWDNETEAAKKAAKEKARNVLKEIKAGADFAQKAFEHGTDGTRARGGDLGWFSSGAMVKPFENAVFNATKPGVLNDVVETDFGYHIINVTNTKTNAAYKVAIVEQEISPSDATSGEAYRRAEAFAANLDGVADFEDRAKKEGVAVIDAKNVTVSDRQVGALGESRQIVQWLFRDASEGKASTVFDLQDQYVVAIMTNEVKKGYKTFETVKEDITPEVRKEVKSRLIISKLSKNATGSLEDIAKAYGSDANIYSSSDLKLSSGALPQQGSEPVAVGVAFSLENGKRSNPFKGETGVFVMELQNKTIAPAIADYSAYKAGVEQAFQNRSSFAIAETIKEYAKIEDERYKIY